MRTNDVVVRHEGLDGLFLLCRESDANALQSSDTCYRVIEGFTKLDSGRLHILSEGLAHIQHGLGGSIEDAALFADVGEGEQHILAALNGVILEFGQVAVFSRQVRYRIGRHAAGIMRRLQHLDGVRHTRLRVERLLEGSVELIFEEAHRQASTRKDGLSGSKRQSTTEHGFEAARRLLDFIGDA